MGLEKAIASGQEYRKPYYGAKAVCFNCRNHGTCDYCKGNRLYGTRKRKAAADAQQEEYETCVCGGEDSAADVFYESRLAVLTKKDTGIATWLPTAALERTRQRRGKTGSVTTFVVKIMVKSLF